MRPFRWDTSGALLSTSQLGHLSPLVYNLATPSAPLPSTRRARFRGQCGALGQKDLGSSPGSIFRRLRALGPVTWGNVTEVT